MEQPTQLEKEVEALLLLVRSEGWALVRDRLNAYLSKAKSDMRGAGADMPQMALHANKFLLLEQFLELPQQLVTEKQNMAKVKQK